MGDINTFLGVVSAWDVIVKYSSPVVTTIDT